MKKAVKLKPAGTVKKFCGYILSLPAVKYRIGDFEAFKSPMKQ